MTSKEIARLEELGAMPYAELARDGGRLNNEMMHLSEMVFYHNQIILAKEKADLAALGIIPVEQLQPWQIDRLQFLRKREAAERERLEGERKIARAREIARARLEECIRVEGLAGALAQEERILEKLLEKQRAEKEIMMAARERARKAAERD